jgi:hypothetical protein
MVTINRKKLVDNLKKAQKFADSERKKRLDLLRYEVKINVEENINCNVDSDFTVEIYTLKGYLRIGEVVNYIKTCNDDLDDLIFSLNSLIEDSISYRQLLQITEDNKKKREENRNYVQCMSFDFNATFDDCYCFSNYAELEILRDLSKNYTPKKDDTRLQLKCLNFMTEQKENNKIDLVVQATNGHYLQQIKYEFHNSPNRKANFMIDSDEIDLMFSIFGKEIKNLEKKKKSLMLQVSESNYMFNCSEFEIMRRLTKELKYPDVTRVIRDNHIRKIETDFQKLAKVIKDKLSLKLSALKVEIDIENQKLNFFAKKSEQEKLMNLFNFDVKIKSLDNSQELAAFGVCYKYLNLVLQSLEDERNVKLFYSDKDSGLQFECENRMIILMPMFID